MSDTEKTTNIKITDSAQGYLTELLAKQNTDGIGVRIFVEHPGTPRAECCMSYSQSDEHNPDDLKLDYETFTAYIDTPSIPYLEDAVIDYNKDRFGGQLTFRAPNSKVPKLGENASLEERINYVLSSEINPNLAAHGGNVQLVDLVHEEGVGIILKAIGIPTSMFTVIFALARTSGWISHWLEMHSAPYKIGRPRQLYTGYTQRDFVAVEDRD